MLVVGVIALLLGLLLVILPSIRIKSIEVVGNTVTPTEEILLASGVEVGDQIVGLDLHAVMASIQSKYPVQVKLTLTMSKLTIEITEREALCVPYGDRWFSLDRNLEVVAVGESEEDFQGVLRVKLPAIEGMAVGQKVVFCNKDTDRSYITEVLDWLDEAGLTDRVDLLDVSEKYHVSYILDGSTQIVLGSVKDLGLKQSLAERILEGKELGKGGAIVDVSNTERSTYRPVEAVELLGKKNA